MRTKLFALAAICGGVLMLSGCVTNEKVAVTQIGDENLSCDQIKGQSVKLDAVAEKARDNKGVNTANVDAVIFFWPAAVGNYMDSDHAEQLIEKRRGVLATLYQGKKCGAAG